MHKLTTDEYYQQQASCDNLCHITDDMLTDGDAHMRCVTCPFCKQTVDAVLTQTTISCPACEVVVQR